MIRYRETYDVVTEESSQDGDTADNGFCLPGGWQFSMNEPSTLDDAQRGEFDQKDTLPDLIEKIQRNGMRCVGDTFVAYSEMDYRTGEETTYYLHIENPRDLQAVCYAIDNNLRINPY